MRTSFVLTNVGCFYQADTPGVLICIDAVITWRNVLPLEPAIRVTLSDSAGVGFRKVVIVDRYAKVPTQPTWPAWYLTTGQRQALFKLGLMASLLDGTFYMRISRVKRTVYEKVNE